MWTPWALYTAAPHVAADWTATTEADRPLRPLRMLAILIAEVVEVGDLNRGGRSAGDRDRGIRPSRGVRRL